MSKRLKTLAVATSVYATSAIGFASYADAAPYVYSLTVIPHSTGDSYSEAWGVNDLGFATGMVSTATGNHAYIYDISTNIITDIGDLPGGGSTSIGYGINNANVVVGAASASTGTRAFRWENGVMTNLGDLAGGTNSSTAWSINDAGQIAGFGHNANGRRGFRWQNGVMTTIPLISGGFATTDALGTGINDAGQVTGDSSISTQFASHAYIWNGSGSPTNLNDLPGGDNSSRGYDINNNSQVVGYGELGSQVRHATLWNGSATAIDLGDLAGGANSSRAWGINDFTYIVGESEAADGLRAFLWTADTGMVDLNSLVPPSTFIMQTAHAIANNGYIVGTGLDTINHTIRGFILSAYQGEDPEEPPVDVPAPGALALLGLGLIALATMRRRNTTALPLQSLAAA